MQVKKRALSEYSTAIGHTKTIKNSVYAILFMIYLDWSIIRSWIKVHCVPLTPSNVLNTYNMCKKCLENFLEQRETIFASHTIFYDFGMSDGCRIFWQSTLCYLQMLFDVVLKNFLDIFYTCCRYLKHSLGSGEHNALWFMIVSYFNQDISWQVWHTHYFLWFW